MPNQSFSGKVLFANAVPAPAVHVRVFDKDIGTNDDDLTITEGVSNSNGDFTVVYDPSRYQDNITQTIKTWGITSPGSWNRPPTWGWVTHTVSAPDLTDVYLPYLQFSYTVGGQSRVQTAPLLPPGAPYVLPDVAPLGPFTPSVHGFKFDNNFPGYPLPFTVPGLPSIPAVPSNYGLCGGMSSAAADFFLASRPIPATTSVPAQGSPLQQFIYKRQMDTFGGGVYIKKFADWMALPDDTPLGIQRKTSDEFAKARALLDAHNLVVLGLVYVSLPRAIWENHQVLAYGYSQATSGFDIRIYDPNFHGNDNVTIHAQSVSVGSRLVPGSPPRMETVWGLQCVQNPGGKLVRGFFVMPYQPVMPPPGL